MFLHRDLQLDGYCHLTWVKVMYDSDLILTHIHLFKLMVLHLTLPVLQQSPLHSLYIRNLIEKYMCQKNQVEAMFICYNGVLEILTGTSYCIAKIPCTKMNRPN